MGDVRSVLVSAVCALVVVGGAVDAGAAPMPHYDLAGLALTSDAIVVATRRPASDRSSSYHVTRVVRGAIAVGADLVLDDGLYATAGRAVDAEVVAFLRRTDAGGWDLTSSGLRVTARDEVFRFEQWSNPGGFTMVAQGHDPTDPWRGDVAPIDRATFDRELATAVERADGVIAALAIADPARRRAAALALLAPAGVSQATRGFYRDEVAARVATGLAAVGDLDGALDARARDRSGLPWFDTLAPAPALLAIARGPTAGAARRAQALAALRDGALFADIAAVRAVLGLVEDPAPRVRAAAIKLAASVWRWSGGRAADQAINRVLRREVTRALARRFAIETDDVALNALAVVHDGRRLPPRRAGPRIVAALTIADGGLRIEVRCLRPARLRRPAIVAVGAGPATALSGWVSTTCGADRVGRGDGAAIPWTPGALRVALQLEVDGEPVTLPIATVIADGDGELVLDPP
ncbi:MAG: hypothetical protein IPL61_24335 [Myxococcales bacterium]|nr:hypothetical protein [Myxococcales bacterium]